MGQGQGECAVIAQQQGAAAIGIEAADGMEPCAMGQVRRQQIEHGAAALGVRAGGMHASGFVQQQGQALLGRRQGATVHPDLIAERIGLIAKACRAAIEQHPLLANQCFRATAGADPRLGQEFLQPLRAHGWELGSDSCTSAPPPL